MVSSLKILTLIEPLELLFKQPSKQSRQLSRNFVQPTLPKSAKKDRPPMTARTLVLGADYGGDGRWRRNRGIQFYFDALRTTRQSPYHRSGSRRNTTLY